MVVWYFALDGLYQKNLTSIELTKMADKFGFMKMGRRDGL